MSTPDREFEPFGKIPRLQRDICITEKIDGTNGGILIELGEPFMYEGPLPPGITIESRKADCIYAASRKRWITPEKDNYGFARWVEENMQTLVSDLGPGMHFGEWWGQGVQRKYDMDHKHFSLFNVRKWGARTANRDPRCARSGRLDDHISSKGERICACREERGEVQFETPNLGIVPVMYNGPFTGSPSTTAFANPWDWARHQLQEFGSVAAPGFMNPEGIIVYHIAAGQPFKYTLDGDGSKGEAR